MEKRAVKCMLKTHLFLSHGASEVERGLRLQYNCIPPEKKSLGRSDGSLEDRIWTMAAQRTTLVHPEILPLLRTCVPGMHLR